VKVETEGLAEVGDSGCPSDAVVTAAVAVAAGADAGVVAAAGAAAVDESAPKFTPAAAQYWMPNWVAAGEGGCEYGKQEENMRNIDE
jgi:hypothetical protein